MEYNPDTHSMKCPKCERGMEEVSLDEVIVDRCTHCKGLWFDTGETEALTRHRKGASVDTGDPAAGRDWDIVEDIDCPRCGKQMEKGCDPEQPHIWFEYCEQHGMFLDAGEFTDLKHKTWADWFRSLIRGER